MVKKILKILYTCLKKDCYYIFLFLNVSQCKFRQKETILKLGNAKKGSQNSPNQKSAGVLPSPPFTKALHWNHWEPSESKASQPNFLSVYNSKIIKICSEKTERERLLDVISFSVWINIWMY